ncbi:hypothetical protein C8R43DRAFT_1145348 [Mycena crocata]|nr:hypothetical protein C8R43DRAFT_1145348 [Mycena crocata]
MRFTFVHVPMLPPVDSSSPAFTWLTLVPGSIARKITLIGAIVILLCYLAWFASSSRIIRSMNKKLDITSELYHRAVDNHILDFELESDRKIRNWLYDLQKQANDLQIRTLRLNRLPVLSWWKEFGAVFNGHVRAILECTWEIEVLKNELKCQLIIESRGHVFNANAGGVSLSRQLWLRCLHFLLRFLNPLRCYLFALLSFNPCAHLPSQVFAAPNGSA